MPRPVPVCGQLGTGPMSLYRHVADRQALLIAMLDAVAQGIRLQDQIVLRHLLENLPPRRRDAFVATQVLGLSDAEAAQVYNCPIGTILSRVARARVSSRR